MGNVIQPETSIELVLKRHTCDYDLHLPMNQLTIFTLPEEVIRRICRLLAARVYPFYPTAPRGLVPVSLVLTCRCLSQIALDVLWHTLRSPLPLLCTLPEDLFAFRPVTASPDGEFNYEKYEAVSET